VGDFRTILAEGDFYDDAGAIKVQCRGEIIDVSALLATLIGDEIHLAIHYVPPMPPDMTKWGGGCCNYQISGFCPAGHHTDPYRLLNVHGQGVLRFNAHTGWCLEKFDGSRQEFPIKLLVGHHARLVAATVFDVEKMRDSISPMDMDQVDCLGVKAESLQDILVQLKKQVKEFS
jgi:hypothetical protein